MTTIYKHRNGLTPSAANRPAFPSAKRYAQYVKNTMKHYSPRHISKIILNIILLTFIIIIFTNCKNKTENNLNTSFELPSDSLKTELINILLEKDPVFRNNTFPVLELFKNHYFKTTNVDSAFVSRNHNYLIERFTNINDFLKLLKINNCLYNKEDSSFFEIQFSDSIKGQKSHIINNIFKAKELINAGEYAKFDKNGFKTFIGILHPIFNRNKDIVYINYKIISSNAYNFPSVIKLKNNIEVIMRKYNDKWYTIYWDNIE